MLERAVRPIAASPGKVRMSAMQISLTTRRFTTLCLKSGVSCVSFALLISSLCSQEVPQAPVQSYPQNQLLPATQPLPPESLNQLLSPIALYPDALIALILPASTVPSDVVLASRYVGGNGDPKQIPNQSWDNSVQSLASYPDVVIWMAQNLEWTTSLGEAFLVQPAEVMNAIQKLRAQAQAAGNLVSTPQQVIVKEKTFIRIVPAEPEYLYVPQYDPEIVYVQPYSQGYGPLITFGVGFAVGSWLNYDFDWNRHQIYRGDWQPGWNDSNYGNGGSNIVNVVNINQNTAQPWQASSRSRHQLTEQQQSFQPASNKFGNTQAPLEVTGATADSPRQRSRQVPQPSRANFGNRGAGNRSSTAPAQQPSAASTQTTAGAATVVQPTTAPNAVGQMGKPLRNINNANVGRNVKIQQQGKRDSQPLPSAVQAPQNSAPGQDGRVPAASISKSQSGRHTATSRRVPQPTRAPVVDQNGRTQPTAAQPTTSGKLNQRANSSLQRQDVPALNQSPIASGSSGKNSARKNNNPDRPNNPPAPIQKNQSVAGNNRPQQKAQEQSNQPQQPSQAQNKHSTESKANKPARQQQPKQEPQPQKQQPRQQPKRESQPQQQKAEQKAPSQGKRQEQKAAPAPKQNPAPAAKAQGKPAGKKSDKKDEPKPQ